MAGVVLIDKGELIDGKPVLIVKNISREGPGLLDSVLSAHKIPSDLSDLTIGDPFPAPQGYSVVFVFGGPNSANDESRKMREELVRIRETVDAGVPFLGICLGMQALVKACGGNVVKSPAKEIGWQDDFGKPYEIDFTDEGKADPLFKGVKSPMKIFQLHGETVELADGMSVLATGKHCRMQAVRVGKNAYGIQGHLELTERMLMQWLTQDDDLLHEDASEILLKYATMQAEYEKNGKKVLGNFLKIAGII